MTKKERLRILTEIVTELKHHVMKEGYTFRQADVIRNHNIDDDCIEFKIKLQPPIKEVTQ